MQTKLICQAYLPINRWRASNGVTLLHASAPLPLPFWHISRSSIARFYTQALRCHRPLGISPDHPLHALRSNPDPLPPPFARQVIYAGVVVTANVKLCLMTLTFNWINSLFLVLHLVGWYGFALVYHNVEAFGTVFAIGEQFASPSFWLVHVVTVTICHVPGILFFVIRENYFPTLKVCACQLPREKNAGGGGRCCRRWGIRVGRSKWWSTAMLELNRN